MDVGDRRTRRTVLGAVVAAALVVAVSSCSSQSTAASCADWVDFTGAQEMSDAADIVITSESVTRDGTEVLLGVDAHAYEVVVETVEQGDATPGETIRVISTPDTCGPSSPYADGDPLDVDRPVRLYLGPAGPGWSTLTPFDGVEHLGW